MPNARERTDVALPRGTQLFGHGCWAIESPHAAQGRCDPPLADDPAHRPNSLADTPDVMLVSFTGTPFELGLAAIITKIEK